MRRISLLMVAILATFSAVHAERIIRFAYDARAELVSGYLWRGQNFGGLSIQPDFAIGFDSDHTTFRTGTWWSLGASDWGFRKGITQTDNYNPNTYFTYEADIYLEVNLWGATMGATQYIFFDGNPFTSDWTEVSLGYDFSTLLKVGAYINYNIFVAGDDDNDNDKRLFSDYLALGYNHEWKKLGMTLGCELGMTTHAGEYAEKTAVTNLQIRLEKVWEFDKCELTVFGMGMINPYGISRDKESILVKASGDDKLHRQTLNGCLGMGIGF